MSEMSGEGAVLKGRSEPSENMRSLISLTEFLWSGKDKHRCRFPRENGKKEILAIVNSRNVALKGKQK